MIGAHQELAMSCLLCLGDGAAALPKLAFDTEFSAPWRYSAGVGVA
jgi:hypothetical protein